MFAFIFSLAFIILGVAGIAALAFLLVGFLQYLHQLHVERTKRHRYALAILTCCVEHEHCG